uniref:Ig-like domain-containing protein n=1 Tax=Oryzias latipes TaxID=8090 RepID=A0A3P9IF56_ORYLA
HLYTLIFLRIHSQTWGVEYASKHICAFEGSTVEISCTFKYPPWINDKKTVVQRAFWFTKLKDNNPLDLREDPYYAGRVTYHFSEKNSMLRIRGLKRSDFAEYKFRFETNQPGGSSTGSPGVFLTATETSSVSVSPSAEVLEGSSVTLTCSSDANPAANYTWFKDNRTLLSEDKVHFSSIRFEHSGNYSCKSENKHGQSSSTPLFLDVQYPPRIPSVSVSGKISKGSSVTLTCSSDANPAANFSWYKKDEDSPKASGPNWTISDFRAEHSGFYYCEAENRRGRLNSKLKSRWGRCEFVDLLVLQLNTSPDINSPSAETEAAEEQLELHYSSIHFSKNQEECLYSNIRRNPKPRQRPEDNSVEYSAVGFKKSAEVKK